LGFSFCQASASRCGSSKRIHATGKTSKTKTLNTHLFDQQCPEKRTAFPGTLLKHLAGAIEGNLGKRSPFGQAVEHLSSTSNSLHPNTKEKSLSSAYFSETPGK
jgi:hypothetical protein